MKNIVKSLIVGLCSVAIVLGATVAFSEPGSKDDPLVTSSYVDTKIKQLKDYIDSKVAKDVNNGDSLVVVNLEPGQSIIGKNGTEIILRSGRSTAIASESGGLADITSGEDIFMNGNIPKNHLLIISRDDGRGVYAVTDSFYLVRGTYEIR